MLKTKKRRRRTNIDTATVNGGYTWHKIESCDSPPRVIFIPIWMEELVPNFLKENTLSYIDYQHIYMI